MNQYLGEMCYYIGLHFNFNCLDIQLDEMIQKRTDNEKDDNRSR